jgi:hypothetical protein
LTVCVPLAPRFFAYTACRLRVTAARRSIVPAAAPSTKTDITPETAVRQAASAAERPLNRQLMLAPRAVLRSAPPLR